jgi:uncharacterized protein (UPF0332 family)
MTALSAARAHLAKAREFLEAAELEHGQQMHNAATSNAVLSAVNSKDAICLKLAGRTTKSDDHAAAALELAATGSQGRELAPTFRRLLARKTKAQYQTASVTAVDARRAIDQATRLYDAAQRIVTS